MDKKIKVFEPYVSPGAVANVMRVLQSGYIAEGPEVKAFELEFAKKFGFDEVVALNSGTAALELAYELAGIDAGDEVITPVFPFVGTNIPLARRKAKIIFADVDTDLNVSIDDVKRKITPQTKAIVFVSFAGNNRGLAEMRALADEYKIPLIEDAAQAVGSDGWGKGDFVCVSLQAIKTLTSGDGGFLILKDKGLVERARRLRWFGFDRDARHKYEDSDITEAGYKSHMNDIAAAIGRGNLDVIDEIIAHRKKLMEAYRAGGVENTHIWLPVVFNDKRDELRAFLKERGIDSSVHHFRSDKYTLFGGLQQLPNMDELQDKFLLLPLHMGVTIEDVEMITKAIRDFNETHQL